MQAQASTLSPEQAVQMLSEPLSRYLQRYSGDPALAEDLLQETLTRVARGLETFEGRSRLETWAFSIATRVAADHFRSSRHTLPTVEMDESEELSDSDIGVDQRVVHDEMNACVRSVIDTLPEDYRAALVLHDLQGLTAAETAEACGCSVPTAKVRIHRARLRLRDALQHECEFYHDEENVLRCDRKACE